MVTDTMNIKLDAHRVNGVSLDLQFDRLPSASVRGNSRLHHIPKSLATKAEREFGVLIGMQLIAQQPSIKFPLIPSSIEIVAQSERSIDGDNLLIGYKPFIDGLVRSGVLEDDEPIKTWTIQLLTGNPNTKMKITGREIE